MKAILISEDNINMLVQRFAVDPDEKYDVLPVGYWLVTNFGNDEYFDVVSEDQFNLMFNKGDELQNGFIEITRKL